MGKHQNLLNNNAEIQNSSSRGSYKVDNLRKIETNGSSLTIPYGINIK